MIKKELKKIIDYLNENNLDFYDLAYNYVKSSFDLLIYKDINLNNIWINHEDNICKQFNIKKQKLYNQPCYRIFEFEKPCENCPVLKSKETGNPEEAEVNILQYNFRVRSYPVKNKKEEVVGFIEVVLDITQKRQLQQKLKDEKLKTSLFTNLSHEFRTPLNLMHSSLQLINNQITKLDIADDEKTRFKKYFDLIKENNFRLIKLVNNLLDLNKMDTGEYDIELQNIEIVDFLRNITQSSKYAAKEQGKSINFISKQEKKVIAIDPFEIERVILNLISNALKFTDKGDLITVSLNNNIDFIKIIVKDTGIGIPGNKQKIIFDKFSQVDNSLHRNNEGSGLGLYIVKNIVELHGGNISLESKEKQGSKFIVRLPIKKELKKEQMNLNFSKKCNNTMDRIKVEFSDIYK